MCPCSSKQTLVLFDRLILIFCMRSMEHQRQSIWGKQKGLDLPQALDPEQKSCLIILWLHTLKLKHFTLNSLPSPLIVQGTFVSFGGTISKQSTQHVLYCSIAHGGGAPPYFLVSRNWKKTSHMLTLWLAYSVAPNAWRLDKMTSPREHLFVGVPFRRFAWARCLEKVKTYSPKWWFSGDLSW